MAKKRFIGDNLQSSTFTVNSAKPLDDRSVVRTRADLMDNATWILTENGEPKVYTGMIVSVTNDDTADNNGLYMLRNAAQYTKQSWDSTDANTYNANGWFKIDNVQLQSDWAQTNPNASDYIKNKPSIPTLLEGIGVTLDKNTTNNTITISTEANHVVTNKSLVVTSQHNVSVYEYLVRCKLNGNTLRVGDLDAFCTEDDILATQCNYSWRKTANDTGKYIGLCGVRSAEGSFVIQLDIVDYSTGVSITKTHYFGIVIDTPPDSTFTFMTTCDWNVEIRLLSDDNILLAYLQVPDSFVGDIILTPLRAKFSSGNNIGSFTNDSSTPTISIWDTNTHGLQSIALVDTLLGVIPTEVSSNYNATTVRHHAGKFQVSVLHFFGGNLEIGSKIADSVINDYFLHTLERKLNNVIDENEISTTTQSDWEQNDSSANDYVKNRTHYKEIITGDDANVIFNDTVSMYWVHNAYSTGDMPITCEKNLNSYKGWWKCTLSHAEDTPVELIGMTVPAEEDGVGIIVVFFPIDPSFGNDAVFTTVYMNTPETSGVEMLFESIETFNPFHFNIPSDDSVESDLSLQEQVHVKIEWFPVVYNSRLVQLGFYETSPFESMSDSNSIYALDVLGSMIGIMENKFDIPNDNGSVEYWLINTGEQILSSEAELKITIGTNIYIASIQPFNSYGVSVLYAGSINTDMDGFDPNGQYPYLVGFYDNNLYSNLPINIQVKSDTAIDNFSITINKISNYHKISNRYLPQIGNAIVTVNDMDGRQMSLNTVQLNSKGQAILRLQTKEFPNNAGNDGDLLSINGNGSLQWVSPNSISTNNNLATVATTGDYNDLINTPLPSIYDNATTTVTDYDGNNYTAVAVGDQVWIFQPWKCTHYADGREIPQIPDGAQQSEYQGRFMSQSNNSVMYSHAAIYDLDTLTGNIESNVQGIAPENWHIPSRADYEKLFAYLTLHYDSNPAHVFSVYYPQNTIPSLSLKSNEMYACSTENDTENSSYFSFNSQTASISSEAQFSYKYVLLVCDKTPREYPIPTTYDKKYLVSTNGLTYWTKISASVNREIANEDITFSVSVY